MAIFRAGKRIGNMDIRVGLPRDRSLDNVEGDPRITKHRPGVNTSTSIGRFITQVNVGEGIARANRFLVRLFPPRDVTTADEVGADQAGFDKDSILNSDDMKRNIELMCTSAKLPHRDVLTENYVTYGPGRKMPYAYGYGSNMECMFMGDKFLRQRAFFETWQGKMHSLKTHNLQYYDNYIGSMEIYQLGQYREADNEHPNDNYRMTYGVRLHEVFPETIGEIQYQSVTDDMIPMDIPVTFAYRTWENITLDSINGVDFGKGVPDMPNIKPAKNYGIFGGILAKMPPEIKRATKQVVDKIKRDVPIGKGTGGRVFPPYEINR
tara:strand:+ start:87 stop:1052 length:966 start_codon:yes stop_codon:yes gene_type:complete